MEDQVNEATGEIVRVERQLPAQNATVAAAAAGASAMVQARIMVAMQRPRDIDEVRRRLLNECKRPRFAETARYAKPMGGRSVVGWSIRFAEAAVRMLGNVDVRATTISEDEEKVVIRFEAIDLETNSSFGGETTVNKTVERRQLRQGETALYVRTNSKGQPTYVVRANEDDLVTKMGNVISKGIRTYAMRHVPADILEECMDVINAGPKEDPTLARKRIVDAYAAMGVGPDQVKQIAGTKDLSLITAQQLAHLRETYTAIRDGETTIEEVLGGEADAKKQSLAEKAKAAAESK